MHTHTHTRPCKYWWCKASTYICARTRFVLAPKSGITESVCAWFANTYTHTPKPDWNKLELNTNKAEFWVRRCGHYIYECVCKLHLTDVRMCSWLKRIWRRTRDSLEEYSSFYPSSRPHTPWPPLCRGQSNALTLRKSRKIFQRSFATGSIRSYVLQSTHSSFYSCCYAQYVCAVFANLSVSRCVFVVSVMIRFFVCACLRQAKYIMHFRALFSVWPWCSRTRSIFVASTEYSRFMCDKIPFRDPASWFGMLRLRIFVGRSRGTSDNVTHTHTHFLPWTLSLVAAKDNDHMCAHLVFSFSFFCCCA